MTTSRKATPSELCQSAQRVHVLGASAPQVMSSGEDSCPQSWRRVTSGAGSRSTERTRGGWSGSIAAAEMLAFSRRET